MNIKTMHAVQGVCEQRHPFASSAAQESMFVEAMKENINWHQEQSPFYRKLLEMKQFDAATLTSIDDLARIPFVPATFFKSHELLSVARDDIKLHLTSSGTTGQKSQVSFDAWSLSAGQKMIDAVFEHFGWNTPDVKTNYLLYSYETAPDSQLGTAHTDNFLCKYAPVASAFYALRRTGAPTTATGGASHEFDVFGCIEKLQHYAAEGLPVRIFGFPAFLFFTLKRMRELGLPPLKLSADSLVFLGGGWKGNADQAIAKHDLYARIHEQLGIPDLRIRDSFGSVEHAVPYAECAHHQFHVPVWSQVIIRDVRTLKPRKFGEAGFLQFLTPYITSVPAQSVLMGDMATLYPGESCACGNERPYFVIHGRAGTSKNKSCAIAAAELLRR